MADPKVLASILRGYKPPDPKIMSAYQNTYPQAAGLFSDPNALLKIMKHHSNFPGTTVYNMAKNALADLYGVNNPPPENQWAQNQPLGMDYEAKP